MSESRKEQKMKTIKCDRCGKEINRHPMQQALFPHFKIYVFDLFGFLREVDLCNDCEDALYSWLKGADDE